MDIREIFSAHAHAHKEMPIEEIVSQYKKLESGYSCTCFLVFLHLLYEAKLIDSVNYMKAAEIFNLNGGVVNDK